MRSVSAPPGDQRLELRFESRAFVPTRPEDATPLVQIRDFGGQGDAMWSYEEFISDRHSDEPSINDSADGLGSFPVRVPAEAKHDEDCVEGRREHTDFGPNK